MEKQEPGFFLTLKEIIELNALTVVVHRQVESGNVEQLKMCLDAGAKIGCKKNGKSLVAAALQKGDEAILNLLWEHDKGNAWASVSDVYRVAVMNNRHEWFEKMLDHQYEGKVLHKLRTLIPEAASMKKWWAIDKAFEKFPQEFDRGLRLEFEDQFVLTELCKDPKSPQHLFEHMVNACKPYWPVVMFFSLSSDKYANRDPVSPLSLLLKNGQYDRAEFLIEQGYPINSDLNARQYDNWFEVYSTVMLGSDEKALSWLIEKGATPFLSKDVDYVTKEMTSEAVAKAWEKSQQKRKVDQFSTNPQWDLALYLAIESGRPDLGKILLKEGCSIERASQGRDESFQKKAFEFERDILKLNAIEKIGGLNSVTPRTL